MIIVSGNLVLMYFSSSVFLILMAGSGHSQGKPWISFKGVFSFYYIQNKIQRQVRKMFLNCGWTKKGFLMELPKYLWHFPMVIRTICCWRNILTQMTTVITLATWKMKGKLVWLWQGAWARMTWNWLCCPSIVDIHLWWDGNWMDLLTSSYQRYKIFQIIYSGVQFNPIVHMSILHSFFALTCYFQRKLLNKTLKYDL